MKKLVIVSIFALLTATGGATYYLNTQKPEVAEKVVRHNADVDNTVKVDPSEPTGVVPEPVVETVAQPTLEVVAPVEAPVENTLSLVRYEGITRDDFVSENLFLIDKYFPIMPDGSNRRGAFLTQFWLVAYGKYYSYTTENLSSSMDKAHEVYLRYMNIKTNDLGELWRI